MATTPSAPIIRNAPRASANTLEYYWFPPASDGGSPILDYQIVLTSDLGTEIYNIGGLGPYYKITGLTDAKEYFTTIAASNAIGLGATASFRPFEPGSPPPLGPSTATAVAGTQASASALVSWTPPLGYPPVPESPIFWYTIESSSSSGSDPVVKYTASGETQSNYLITGLNTNSSYFFKIRAVNCPGYSPSVATNAIQWFNPGSAKLATRIGGTATYTQSRATCDSAGNVYIIYKTGSGTGASHNIYNYSSAPVGGGTVGTTLFGTITGGDRYLVKYNSTGVCQWATIIPNATSPSEVFGAVATTDIICDASGNIYIPGAVAPATISLYSYSSGGGGGSAINTTLTATFALGGANRAFYLLKYNSSGTLTGATRATVSGGSPDIFQPYISTDSSNNVNASFAAASAGTTVTINSFNTISLGAISVTSYGTYAIPASNSVILIKYNQSLAVQWVTAIENTSVQGDYNQTANAVDSAGNVIILGRADTGKTVTIKNFSSGGSPITLTTFGTLAFTGNGHFVVKYNSSGTGIWSARTMYPGLYAIFPTVSIDSSNNIYTVVGLPNGGSSVTSTLYKSSVYSGSIYGTLTTSNGINSVITKYDSSGNILWASKIDTNGGSQTPFDAVCDSTGNLYICIGFDIAYGDTSPDIFNYTSAPSGDSAIILTKYGSIPLLAGRDSFFVKYNSNGTVAWGTRIAGAAAEITGGMCIVGGDLWVVGTFASNPVTINNFGAAPVAAGNVTLTTFGALPDVNTGSGNNLYIVKYTA